MVHTLSKRAAVLRAAVLRTAVLCNAVLVIADFVGAAGVLGPGQIAVLAGDVGRPGEELCVLLSLVCYMYVFICLYVCMCICMYVFTCLYVYM